MNEDTRIEIEALQSIFEDGVTVTELEAGCVRVTRKVQPENAEEASSLSIRVAIDITAEYPEVSPLVSLSEPRGMDDSAPATLRVEVAERLAEMTGLPVLFEIFQLCADFLVRAESNSSVSCPICLCELRSEPSTVTACEHYMHKRCLDRHTQHARKSLWETLSRTPEHMRRDVDRSLYCPVCRALLEDAIEPIQPPPAVPNEKNRRSGKKNKLFENDVTIPRGENEDLVGYDDFDFDWPAWRKELERMKILYERQAAQDGIIDVEKEARRLLVTEEDVVILPGDAEKLSTSADAVHLPTNDSLPSAIATAAPSGLPPPQSSQSSSQREDALPSLERASPSLQTPQREYRGRGGGRRNRPPAKEGRQEMRGGLDPGPRASQPPPPSKPLLDRNTHPRPPSKPLGRPEGRGMGRGHRRPGGDRNHHDAATD